MAGLSIGMAASIAMLGLSSEASSVTVVAAVGAVLSATALSWHGILLSEAARLAPAGTIATVTGGVLSFGQVGAFAGPLIFSLLLGLSGGYAAGWALCDSRVVDWPHAVAPDCGDPAERSRAVPVS
jgi:hypothetical protein